MSKQVELPVPRGNNWEKLFVANEAVREYIRSVVGEGFEEDELFFLLRDLPGWRNISWDRGQALFRLLEEQGVITGWMQENPRRRYYAAADPSETEKYQAKVVSNITERLLRVVGSHHPDIIRRALLAAVEKKGIVL